ncbi:hypothetical protein ACHAXT_007464 [Thalassiosira profunda]
MNVGARWIILLALFLGNSHALCGPRSISTPVSSYASPDDARIKRRRIALSSTASPSSELNRDKQEEIPATTNSELPQSIDVQSTETTTELYSVDVRYNRRSPLTYDATSGRYLDAAQAELTFSDDTKSVDNTIFQRCFEFLHSAFVPEGVSNTYYTFMRWRILQRFVNANVHVIGTQSLLMGLRGMQRSGAVGTAVSSAAKGGAALGAAAATNWVLKDTLGKVVRMAWASKMGRKFDPDAKRWRFRASLIYALGNGLEVSTYLHPQYFLVLAMLANSCKQMSMLTSSATRNALYNSFRNVDAPSNAGGASRATNSTAANSRRGSGGSENIGDITAKGEAQIAVVDLLGIASGICLSRAVGVNVQNVLGVWIVLQMMEIFCMYYEMRSIVYKTFNFERMYTVLGKLLQEEGDDGMNGSDAKTGGKYKFTGHIPTPEEIAAKEKIFLPPDHLARRAIAFGSPGRSVLDPDELDMLVNDVFRGEKYFLVVGEDVKNQRGLSSRVRLWMKKRRGGSQHIMDTGIDPEEQCHIVLHADANNLDILKGALALVILRKKLVKKMQSLPPSSDDEPIVLRSRDYMDILRESRTEATEIFPEFLRELTKQGWRPPLRSMLGRVSARAEWKIRKNQVDSRSLRRHAA